MKRSEVIKKILSFLPTEENGIQYSVTSYSADINARMILDMLENEIGMLSPGYLNKSGNHIHEWEPEETKTDPYYIGGCR